MEAAEQSRVFPVVPPQPAAKDAHNAMENAVSPHHLSLILTDDELALVDPTLTNLETLLGTWSAQAGCPHASLARTMCSKSEAFCRQALGALAQSSILVPSSLRLAEAQSGLATLDRLRPRVQRLQRLVEHLQNMEVTLGNDVLNCALQGYALLRVSGKDQCLDELLKDMPVPQAEPVAA